MPTKAGTSSSADLALEKKFRGIFGAELRVDATFDTHSVLIINVDTGYLFNIGRGVFSPRGASHSGYGGSAAGDRLAVPRHLRMIRYPEDAKMLNAYKAPYFDGPPLVDVTVPVAERIPEETLDDLRNSGGVFRLKLRIHPETLLVGWDIERRPGDFPGRKDTSGIPIYVPPQYSNIGGDFCEQQLVYGFVNGHPTRIVKRGWYIDPETKQRIETDY